MPSKSIIDDLIEDLRPVRPRSPARLAAGLSVLAAIELAAFLALGQMRPDMPVAVGLPAFWWKIGSLAILAVFGTLIAVRSFDPTMSPRPALGRWWALALFALLLGWAASFGQANPGSIVARLNWRMGIACLVTMILLSLPPIVALAGLMRSGAPTDGVGSASAVGAGSAAWGAFVFAFHCPDDDPLYIVVWYSVSFALIVSLSRLILPRLLRW